MMNAENRPEDKKEDALEPPLKKDYASPRLTLHGNLEDITGLLAPGGRDILVGGTVLI